MSSESIETINNFFEQNKDGLLQTYIIERQKNNNELGVILSIINSNNSDNSDNSDNKQNTIFLPITSKLLTEDVKNDIISKNNARNSRAFFYISDAKTNFTTLIIRDLE